MIKKILLVSLMLIFSFSIAAPAFAQHFPKKGDEKTVDKALGTAPYSPYAERKYPTRPLFGDTHLHTGFSMDAGVWGATLTPRDAYRFARGEQGRALPDRR